VDEIRIELEGTGGYEAPEDCEPTKVPVRALGAEKLVLEAEGPPLPGPLSKLTSS
jgi:hypothetical protein